MFLLTPTLLQFLAISDNDLIPVFVEPKFRITYNLDANKVESCNYPDKTKAILTVHLYGQNSIDDQMLEICSNII